MKLNRFWSPSVEDGIATRQKDLQYLKWTALNYLKDLMSFRRKTWSEIKAEIERKPPGKMSITLIQALHSKCTLASSKNISVFLSEVHLWRRNTVKFVAKGLCVSFLKGQSWEWLLAFSCRPNKSDAPSSFVLYPHSLSHIHAMKRGSVLMRWALAYFSLLRPLVLEVNQ